MDKISFTPNIPHQVALRFPDGREVEGRFGNQMMYTLNDGRVMYLDLDVAAKINMLGPRKGEPFWIAKRWTGKKGDPVQWDVWAVGAGEHSPSNLTAIPESTLESKLRRSLEQKAAAGVRAPAPAMAACEPPMSNNRNGTAPSVPAGIVVTASPAPNGTNCLPKPNGNGTPQPCKAADIPNPERPKTKLEDALKTVIAAVFAATEYAKQIGYAAMPQFTSEDLRTMANTLMIQNGGAR